MRGWFAIAVITGATTGACGGAAATSEGSGVPVVVRAPGDPEPHEDGAKAQGADDEAAVLTRTQRLKEGIAQVSATEWTVTPEAVELFFELETGWQGATLTNSSLYGVRPGSALEKLGLKSGDVLVTLNGKPLHNADMVRAASQALGKQKAYTLVIMRNDPARTLTHVYRVK